MRYLLKTQIEKTKKKRKKLSWTREGWSYGQNGVVKRIRITHNKDVVTSAEWILEDSTSSLKEVNT
jgi:hypothetical protein